MRIEKRYPIAVGDPDRFNIALVGCGGTGSFLALHIARLAYHARDRYGREVNLHFIDPDTVEPHNIGRQNFCPAEIGQHKAQTLARRYSVAFGVKIEFTNERFDRHQIKREHRDFRVIVGAVDNAAAREAIDKYVRWETRTWWLDCGNFEHAGQVLIGNKDILAPEINVDLCGALPLPTVQHPELLQPEPVVEAESCAELALVDAQSLMINQAVATYAAQYLYRLVITRDLDIYATYIDLMTGSARSLGISREVSEN
jgi:PRTRC genetic system ThiF family protein